MGAHSIFAAAKEELKSPVGKTSGITEKPIADVADIKNDNFVADAVYPQLFTLSADGFPIGGWAEPLPPELTDGKDVMTSENYLKIKECGFDFVCSIYALYPKDKEIVRRQLDSAGKAGVKIFVSDAAVQKEEINAQRLKENYNDIKDNPGFMGYLVKDEPGSKMFALLAERKKAIEGILGKVPLYYNLLPTYSTGFMLENGYWSNEAPIVECDKVAYEKYVRDFVSLVRPEFLSYDFYPFAAGGRIYKDYFLQLSIAAHCSADAGIPFIPFAQCCSFNRFSENPTDAKIRWQANTSVAYGASGLQYFTLWTPPDNPVEKFKGCVLGKYGQTTVRYPRIKRLNAFLKKMGRILLPYCFEGIILSGNSPAPVPERDIINGELELGGDAIAGRFSDRRGKKAYYVVCNRVFGQCKITVRTNTDKTYMMITERTERKIKDNVLTRTLRAGEAFLIIENQGET